MVLQKEHTIFMIGYFKMHDIWTKRTHFHLQAKMALRKGGANLQIKWHFNLLYKPHFLPSFISTSAHFVTCCITLRKMFLFSHLSFWKWHKTDISRGIAFTWKYFLLEVITPKVYSNLNSTLIILNWGFSCKTFHKHTCIHLSYIIYVIYT